MLQNYNFSTNLQGVGHYFSFYRCTSSHVIPLVFSFSNRNEPNFAQTYRMIRIVSVRDRFSVAPAAMSCRRWPERWRASVAAVFLSFCLETKGPKIQGRHQGPTALGDRTSPMSAGPAHPTQWSAGVPVHGVRWCAMQAGMSSPRWPVRGHGIYACGLSLSSGLL